MRIYQYVILFIIGYAMEAGVLCLIYNLVRAAFVS